SRGSSGRRCRRATSSAPSPISRSRGGVSTTIPGCRSGRGVRASSPGFGGPMHRNADQLLARARERFAAGDWFGTLYLVDDLLETESGFADAHQLRGVALALLGRPEDALAAFDAALARNPEYVEALAHRGVVLAELGRGEDAAKAFERAVQAEAPEGRCPRAVAGRIANLHAQLGEAYSDAGAPHEAVFEYRRALSLGPDFHDLRCRLGRHLVAAGRYLEAREELERVLRVRPEL